MIHYLRGSLFFPRGDIARCLEAHQRARHYADRAGAPKLRARAMSGLGDAYYMRGQFRSANRHYDECIRLARERGMTSIEAANLGARGMTRYLLGDLDAALQDSASGAELSARIGDRRAEMVTRCGSLAFVLLEMERFAQARGELEIALELARSLSARRFESHALAMLGHITAAEGDRAAGLAMIEDGLAICEEIGYAFMGPAALGLVARLTDDDDARQRALDRGERVLRSGAVSHNYLFFYRDAMEVAVARGDADALARFAGELEAYTRREPTRWSQFVIERARALAAHAAGSRDEALLQALRDLRDEADGRGFRAAARALAAACQAS
jgi:tetratricopeptide (TPR) repeat protein